MNYELKNPVNKDFSLLEQVLFNRGIKQEEMYHYLHTTDKDINNPQDLNEDRLKQALYTLLEIIKVEQDALVIIDVDTDGYTSAALLINFLYDLFPHWVQSHLSWFTHDKKQHGLSDLDFSIFENNPNLKLVLVPDAGSNDIIEHQQLKDLGVKLIILDHHQVEYEDIDAIIINNQFCNYPNKQLSGVGVVYQFCRYINENLANQYLDLVALGLIADLMNLKSFETKRLIEKGLENITNPFFYQMTQQNAYALGLTEEDSHITPIGVGFYIAPYINAITRSGTIEEKKIIFSAMLKFEAFKKVPSTKRGHQEGEQETILNQAIRVVQQVKRRQTKEVDNLLNNLSERLSNNTGYLSNKFLFFNIDNNISSRNIFGLVANKIMHKYQLPCMIVAPIIIDGIEYYRGSARGPEGQDFRQLCLAANADFATGHSNAFGISIKKDELDTFLKELATQCQCYDSSKESLYVVDKIYNMLNIQDDLEQDILTIGQFNNLWGEGMAEPLIALTNIKVSKNNYNILSPDKNPTLKITLPNNVSLIYFGISQEQIDELKNVETGEITLDVVGICNINKYQGNVNPQIKIVDYQIINSQKYIY